MKELVIRAALDLDEVGRFDDLFEFPEIETFSHGVVWYSNDKLSPSRERSQAVRIQLMGEWIGIGAKARVSIGISRRFR